MTTQQPAETHHYGEVQEELLKPGAAALLFGISESTVRAARLRGNVTSPVVMGISGKTDKNSLMNVEQSRNFRAKTLAYHRSYFR